VYTASFKTPKGPPRNYYVPNFGMDQDIVDAQQNIKTEEKLNGAWNPVRNGAGGFDMPALDPNGGQSHTGHHFLQLDSEIKDDPVCNSSGCTQYLFPKEDPDHPKDYAVPNNGVDADILASHASLKDAANRL